MLGAVCSVFTGNRSRMGSILNVSPLKVIDVAEGKGCCFVAAQYANKEELVLHCNAYV